MSRTAASTVRRTHPQPLTQPALAPLPSVTRPYSTHSPSVHAVNCNIFLCDDSDCGEDCRVVEGRDQVEVAADMGVVYGNVQDANGEDFEIDLEEGTTYYIWTNIGTSDGHISDTTMTLFDADGTTVLAQNDDGPVGAVNSYIEYTPTAAISAATLLVAPKTRQDRGTFQLQVSLTEPDLTIRPPPPAPPVDTPAPPPVDPPPPPPPPVDPPAPPAACKFRATPLLLAVYIVPALLHSPLSPAFPVRA
jgi:hypothetical protein